MKKILLSVGILFCAIPYGVTNTETDEGEENVANENRGSGPFFSPGGAATGCLLFYGSLATWKKNKPELVTFVRENPYIVGSATLGSALVGGFLGPSETVRNTFRACMRPFQRLGNKPVEEAGASN